MPADRRDRLFRLGRDSGAAPLLRFAARTLSVYERAPLRQALGSEAIGPLDDAIVAVLAAGLTRGRNSPSLAIPAIDSGWRGNLLFLGVWSAALALIVLFFVHQAL